MIYELLYDACLIRFSDVDQVWFLSKYILQFVLDFNL